MADFRTAYSLVKIRERGYAWDPDDNGGETWNGISRKFHPNWAGWILVDEMKKLGILTKTPQTETEKELFAQLEYEEDSFYINQFWNPLKLTTVNNQQIANILFDSAVNEGISSAVKRAQQIVGMPQTGTVSPQLIDKLNAL